MKPISVLLVDDHELMRQGVSTYIESAPDMELTRAVGSAADAILECKNLRPDVVLMDVDMPGKNPFEAAGEIRKLRPEIHIIFSSAFSNDRYIENALALSASGYVTKSDSPKALMEAIRSAISGAAYYSPEVRSRLVANPHMPGRLMLAKNPSVAALSNREIEILRYLARGLSKKEIAYFLSVSVNTVDNHTSHIMTKLKIHDRVELARFAIREGLVDA